MSTTVSFVTIVLFGSFIGDGRGSIGVREIHELQTAALPLRGKDFILAEPVTVAVKGALQSLPCET